MIENHPHRSLAYFWRKLVGRLARHGSTFSGVGASDKPGAVQSKAKRLRKILPTLSAGQQAKLLGNFLRYRDSPAREGQVDLLDQEWRQAYQQIVDRIDQQVRDADQSYAASTWTGRRTMREQVVIVRELAPVALAELDALASLIESKRFNDAMTADAIKCLRQLHEQIGELIGAVDRGRMTRQAVEAIEANRQRLMHYVEEGAKLTMVAPAMTFGVMHILAWVTGVPIDSTLASTVFGAIVGADALKSFGKRSSIAP